MGMRRSCKGSTRVSFELPEAALERLAARAARDADHGIATVSCPGTSRTSMYGMSPAGCVTQPGRSS
jgi:hypothetical protein